MLKTVELFGLPNTRQVKLFVWRREKVVLQMIWISKMSTMFSSGLQALRFPMGEIIAIVDLDRGKKSAGTNRASCFSSDCIRLLQVMDAGDTTK